MRAIKKSEFCYNKKTIKQVQILTLMHFLNSSFGLPDHSHKTRG